MYFSNLFESRRISTKIWHILKLFYSYHGHINEFFLIFPQILFLAETWRTIYLLLTIFSNSCLSKAQKLKFVEHYDLLEITHLAIPGKLAKWISRPVRNCIVLPSVGSNPTSTIFFVTKKFMIYSENIQVRDQTAPVSEK